MEFNLKTISQDILNHLAEKQQDVLGRRFGLFGKNKETLQKIGEGFNITRERVRQIERDLFKKLRNLGLTNGASDFFIYLNNYFKQNGSAKREDLLLTNLALNDEEKNSLLFLLELNSSFERFSENNQTFAFWVNDKKIKEKVIETADLLVAKVKETQKPIKENELFLMSGLKNKLFFQSCFEISKLLEKNPLGEVGLSSWVEVKPRGVRDAIYLILKHYQKPLHFQEIANLSNNFQGSGIFQKKKVLPQTAHNELIRDERFVLVGRGTYGLKEWGLKSGTVKELIKIILTESGALSKKEVLAKVRAQRVIKDNTIYLNLANKAEFEKDEQGKYQIKTA